MNELDLSESLQDLIRVILVPNDERISLEQIIAILDGKQAPKLGPIAKKIKERHLVMRQRFDKMHGKVVRPENILQEELKDT